VTCNEHSQAAKLAYEDGGSIEVNISPDSYPWRNPCQDSAASFADPKWLRFAKRPSGKPKNQEISESVTSSHRDRTNLHKPSPRPAAFPSKIQESVTSFEISEVIGVHRCLLGAPG